MGTQTYHNIVRSNKLKSFRLHIFTWVTLRTQKSPNPFEFFCVFSLGLTSSSSELLPNHIHYYISIWWSGLNLPPSFTFEWLSNIAFRIPLTWIWSWTEASLARNWSRTTSIPFFGPSSNDFGSNHYLTWMKFQWISKLKWGIMFLEKP